MRTFIAALLGLALWLPGVAAADGPEIRSMTVEEIRLPPPQVPAGWESVEGTVVTVHGRAEERAFLVRLGRTASEEVVSLAATLGVPIGGPIEIFVAPDEKTFRSFAGDGLPEWAHAYALPGSGTIVLRSPGDPKAWDKPYVPVLRHEIVHVLLGRAFVPFRPPRWFDEGMARVFGGQYGPDTVDELALGLAADRLPTLDQIAAGFPADPQRAALAYAMSAAFVSWLRVEYGDDAMRRWVRGLAEQRGMDSALYAATGRTLDQVDTAFRADLASSHLSFAGYAQVGLGAGLGLVAVAALIAQRRRLRGRMRAMAEKEARERAILEGWLQRRAAQVIDLRPQDTDAAEPQRWVH